MSCISTQSLLPIVLELVYRETQSLALKECPFKIVSSNRSQTLMNIGCLHLLQLELALSLTYLFVPAILIQTYFEPFQSEPGCCWWCGYVHKCMVIFQYFLIFFARQLKLENVPFGDVENTLLLFYFRVGGSHLISAFCLSATLKSNWRDSFFNAQVEFSKRCFSAPPLDSRHRTLIAVSQISQGESEKKREEIVCSLFLFPTVVISGDCVQMDRDIHVFSKCQTLFQRSLLITWTWLSAASLSLSLLSRETSRCCKFSFSAIFLCLLLLLLLTMYVCWIVAQMRCIVWMYWREHNFLHFYMYHRRL